MASLPPFKFLLLLILLMASNAMAIREYDRREELKEVPPVSELGWTVPLAGADKCISSTECYNTLSRPGENKTLAALAIGRGVFNYSCEGLLPANPPLYVAQYTELYDAAALAANLPTEQFFHDLIPKLYGFDFGALKNSTLDCMGSIGTLDSTAVITLYSIDTFRGTLQETIKSPENASFNGLWSYSTSSDQSWEFYRVEMAGGAVPRTCAGQPSAMSVEYVAEYWFYH